MAYHKAMLSMKFLLVLLLIMQVEPLCATTLLEEKFDDANFISRGWFDSASPPISTAQFVDGSTSSLEIRYPRSAYTPPKLSTPMRRTFTATESVYIRYFVKYSDNWEGSNRPYHPHEFYLLTTADDRWIGPSNTHFTGYLEQNEGRLQIGMQDSLNIDASKIGVDLTNITENRAVAGCNGNPDGVGSDCYKASTYRNGKFYRSSKKNFDDITGPSYKGSWHEIEAFFKFNTVTNGKGQANGIMQVWQNGELVIDKQNLIMRTAANANIKFNCILIGPWMDGSPVDQTTWIDDLLVTTSRPEQVSRPMPPEIKFDPTN